MLDVTCRAEECVGGGAAVEVVSFKFADEESNSTTSSFVMNISQASRRSF